MPDKYLNKRLRAEVTVPMRDILKVAWAYLGACLRCTDIHCAFCLFTPMLSLYPRSMFLPSVTFKQSPYHSLGSLETSPVPQGFFLLNCCCILCLSYSHLLFLHFSHYHCNNCPILPLSSLSSPFHVRTSLSCVSTHSWHCTAAACGCLIAC